MNSKRNREEIDRMINEVPFEKGKARGSVRDEKNSYESSISHKKEEKR